MCVRQIDQALFTDLFHFIETNCLLRFILVLKSQLTWRFGIRGMKAGEINKCI